MPINTGNGAAYDIKIAFDPPLRRHEKDASLPTPFRNVSVLRPGGAIRSFLGGFETLGHDTYSVTVSWKRDPAATGRESHKYTLNMGDFEGIAQLGDASPLTQIAREVKHIRDDWRYVASGSHRLKVDQFTTADRVEERERVQRSIEERRSKET